jgi:hypothetical protein
MSDVTTGKGFDSEFLTHPPRWFGRIESSETWRDNIAAQKFDNLPDIKGWGYRYKVRIFSWHTGDMNVIPPDQMVMANVVLPVTSGSGMGGFSETPSLSAGCIVTGFFMDGMGGQEPYIDGVLGNSNNNVPKERGGPAPNDNPTPAEGGSQDLDNKTTAQLKTLLNPARTPTRQEFAAASAAREAATAAGLPKAEIERQVLLATVKASQPNQSPPRQTKEAQSTLGYQLYDSTFNDPNIAKLPDFRTVSKLNLGGVPGPSSFPLYTFDSLHLDPVKSYLMQDEDKKISRPLISSCKKKNSEMKGIQRIIKNLLNEVEKIKKFAGEVTAFADSILGEVNNLLSKASDFVSSFMTSIIGNIMSYVQNKVADGVKAVQGFLFPGEIPTFSSIVEKGLEGLNCVFQKIGRGLASLMKNLLSNLLDKAVNGPLCATEDLISGFLNNVFGDITKGLDSVLGPILAFTQGIGGVISSVAGNIFNALDMVTGILEFFKCDEEKSCPDYNEINLAGPAVPGGDTPAPVPGGNKSPSDGDKNIVADSQNTSEGLSEGKAEGQPIANVAQGTDKPTNQLQVGQSNTETQAAAQQERDLIQKDKAEGRISIF